MKSRHYKKILVSPITNDRLKKRGNKLYRTNGMYYKIVKDVPILLPKEYCADWHRELIEVILWEYPYEIEKIYKDPEWNKSPTSIYVRYIEKLLHDKQGIVNAFNNYATNNTEKWIIKTDSVVSKSQKEKFSKFSRKSVGKARTETKINPEGAFKPCLSFAEKVNMNLPKTIIELGMGAGGGTASIALHMNKTSTLYAIDIGFDCLGNAIGIRKYQRKNIIPICASFWSLPFANSSIDAICTYNGLDESREIEQTIVEVSRVLKDEGLFTVASRKSAFMRQSAILEPFGFTEEETMKYLKMCRIYSDVNELVSICKHNNLKLVSQEEFVINENLTTIISQFQKYGERYTTIC